MPPVIQEENRLRPEEVIASPLITGFSPAAGKFGDVIAIQGRNFSTAQEENQVWLNGTPAPVTHATATVLHVLVPEGSTTGKLKVQTKDGASMSLNAYTVYQPPLISGFSPGEGVVGTVVKLQGNFLAAGALEYVKLGTLACEVVSTSQQELVVRIPVGALTESFRIQTKGGAAQSAAPFVIWHQPVISSLSKQTDRVGSVVEITGENFATAASRNTVLFGQAQAEVLQASTAALKVRVPAGAASGPVTLETPGGKATSAALFEVIPAPVLTSMAPAAGSVGTVVAVEGVHFLTLGQRDTIYFGGVKAVVLSSSETKFTVRVPRGAQTGKVQVAGIGGRAYSTTDFVVEDLAPQQAITVYPNPTTGTFTINFIRANFEVQKIEIMNTIGAKIYSQEVALGHLLEVNLPGLSAGVYPIQLSTSRGTLTKKINLL